MNAVAAVADGVAPMLVCALILFRGGFPRWHMRAVRA